VIAALLLGLVVVGPMMSGDDERQIVVMSWDASTKSCSAKVRGVEVGDPTTKDTRAALARLLPDRHRPIELHGSTDVPYACVGGLVSAMQTDGYRFKVGAMNEAPRAR
jgi:hypothetical protein